MRSVIPNFARCYFPAVFRDWTSTEKKWALVATLVLIVVLVASTVFEVLNSSAEGSAVVQRTAAPSATTTAPNSTAHRSSSPQVTRPPSTTARRPTTTVRVAQPATAACRTLYDYAVYGAAGTTNTYAEAYDRLVGLAGAFLDEGNGAAADVLYYRIAPGLEGATPTPGFLLRSQLVSLYNSTC